jgi:gliding motility-associated-like protein
LSGGGTIATGQGSNSITVNWTTSGGPYQVSVIATNACGNSTAQSIDVTVNASPTAPSIITSGDTICEGESATITATGSTGGAITYNIFSAQTGGSSLGVSPLTVSPTVTTTYYVEVINDLGCRYSGGRVPVTIVVSPAPVAPVITGNNGGVCYNESATLSATSPNSTITWWNAATGGTLLGSGTTLNTGALTNTTTFYAEATNANGCGSLTGRVAVTVNVAQLSSATLTSDAPDNSIFINQALIVTVEPSDYTRYEFFLNGTSVQLDSINTWGSSAFNDGDVVSVIVTDGGCVGNEVELTVRVTDLPNAFTPNGDGRNDDFLKGFELVIINRWGQELYNGFDGWDGYYNGERVSPGTYFYIVRVPDITDTDKVLKGSVLVHY